MDKLMLWPRKRLLCSSGLLFLPTSALSMLPHGIQYLSVKLGDDSVIMGVNTCPQQSVSLLVQAAQVLVRVPVNRARGGGARFWGRGA